MAGVVDSGVAASIAEHATIAVAGDGARAGDGAAAGGRCPASLGF